jgi:hypothetical protein
MNVTMIKDLYTEDEMVDLLIAEFTDISLDEARSMIRRLCIIITQRPNMSGPDLAALLFGSGEYHLAAVITTMWMYPVCMDDHDS